MAADPSVNELAPKSKTKKGRSSGKGQSEPRLKTVVRRLPPNLPENVFWQSVEQWVKDDTVTWKVYHQGKFRKRSVCHHALRTVRSETEDMRID